MRLSGDDEERSTGSMPVRYMILAVGVFILFILLVVYFTSGAWVALAALPAPLLGVLPPPFVK